MNRLLSLLLALILVMSVLSFSASADNGESTAGAQSILVASNYVEDKNLISVINRPYTKVLSDAEFPTESVTSGNVNIAKNETEGIQISLKSPTNKNRMLLRINNSYSGITTEVFYYEYIHANGVDYPDPLIPISTRFDIKADEPKNLIINFTTTDTTAPGSYTYNIDLVNYGGTVIKQFTVTVRVYNITYSESPSLDTAFGLEWRSIAYAYGYKNDYVSYSMTDAEYELTRPKYKMYYDYLLEHKISAIYLPYDILDSRADAYMSDPRVTSFAVRSDIDDETLVQIYNKLLTNEEWIEKAYIYPLDEPTTVAQLNTLIEYKEKYERLCPRLKMTTAFYKNINYSSSKDQVEVLGEILDILCAKVANWNGDDYYYGIAESSKYGSFAERMNTFKSEGKTIWSYVCWEPGKPYTNLLLNEDGLDHRILFWQQYNINSTGLLYWCVNCYGHVHDPWTTVVFWGDDNVHGDGILVYPGTSVNYTNKGIDAPIGSLRLETVRDGIEDYELLMLYKSVFGDDALSVKVNRVSESVISYISDAELFESVKSEMMQELEDANTVVFDDVSASLGENISLTYYVKDNGYIGPRIKVTFNGKTTTVNGRYLQEEGQYAFTFSDIAPQTISDTITAELIVGGETVETSEYSVYKYLNKLMLSSIESLGITAEQHSKMQILIRDLIIYGRAAQYYTKHNTNNILNSGIEGSSFRMLESTDFAIYSNGSNVTFTGATLFFDSVNKLQFMLEAEDISALSFKCSVNGGAETDIECVDNKDGTYTITTAPIKALCFDDVYIITAYKNGTADASIQYSVKSYVFAKQNGLDVTAQLAKATYNYGLSAKAYAG